MKLLSPPPHAAWIAIVSIAAVAGSYVFACAAPLVAVATAAAITLPARQGLTLVLLCWVANQAIGYGLLDYPIDASSIGWGVVLGLAALVAWGSACITLRQAKSYGIWIAAPTAFATAFIANQGFMWAVAHTSLGGITGFTPAIIAQVLSINMVAAAGFAAMHNLLRLYSVRRINLLIYR